MQKIIFCQVTIVAIKTEIKVLALFASSSFIENKPNITLLYNSGNRTTTF